MNDPKGLYVVSKTQTKTDRALAILLGSLDHKEAIRVWEAEGGDDSCELIDGDYYQLSKRVIEQSLGCSPHLVGEGGCPSSPSQRRKPKSVFKPVWKEASTDFSRSIQTRFFKKSALEGQPKRPVGSMAA
jgi:hypothetical protein